MRSDRVAVQDLELDDAVVLVSQFWPLPGAPVWVPDGFVPPSLHGPTPGLYSDLAALLPAALPLPPAASTPPVPAAMTPTAQSVTRTLDRTMYPFSGRS